MSQTFRFAVAATFGLAMAGSAMAADLPLRSPPPVYAPPPPVFTWTGFYLGVNGGYDFDHRSRYLTGTSNGLVALGSAVPTPFRQADAGFTAGGQIGYNYQIGGFGGAGGFLGLGAASIVVGVEADIAYTDLDKTASFTGANSNPVLGPATTTFRSQMDFLGTARGRVGLAFNQFMVYGTGGFAYGDVDSRLVNFAPNGTTVASSGRSSGFTTGYTYGGGIEYALPTGSFLNFFKSSAVTVKAEYLRYELDSGNLRDTGAGTVALPAGYKLKNEGNLARIGLNYKF